MVEGSDAWPAYNIGSKDHLHAVGVLIANWAMVEQTYQALIQTLFGGDGGLALRVDELLGNEGRWNLIADECAKRTSPQFEEHISYFLKCAAICKENRNAVAHAKFAASSDPEFIVLIKGRDRKAAKSKIFHFSIASIREMADETYAVATYGMQMFALMEVCRSERIHPGSIPSHFVLAAKVPLLGRPPQPRKWNLRSQARIQDVPPPPQSSPE